MQRLKHKTDIYMECYDEDLYYFNNSGIRIQLNHLQVIQ